MRLSYAALLVLGLLTACDGALGDVFGGDGGDDDDDGGDDGGAGDGGGGGMLSRTNYADSSDRDGYVEVPIDVGAGTSAFLVTVESGSYPTLEALYSPDGDEVLYWEDWYDSDESLTSAFFWDGKVMALNWPVREQDGPLQQGTWTALVSTIDNQGYYDGNADVEVTTMTKDDAALDRADVRVRIVWAQGVGGDPAVVSAMEGAVERWREVWGAYGLNLVESYHESSLDAELGFVWTGSNDVEANAEKFDGQELILIVGETYDGDGSLYGLAGGIPGSIEPNRYTYVSLSWLAHAGGNGSFSDDEIRLMGETAAHECGHFMGLFHPVESSYNYWDALADTEQCSTWSSCETKLGDNLMFPYPICSYTSCDPQGELTGDQQGVAQRYIGSL